MQRDNDNSDPNTPTEQQGIFSTPDLSVNSENLEAVMPATATNPNSAEADNKARIAAAFAGTEATSKAEALAAAVQQSTTASTVTEDIQLSGERKKRSKLPLFIGLAVVVVAVAGGVTTWAVRRKSKPTPQESFSQYYEYLTNDATTDIDDDGEWPIFQEDQELSYAEGLFERFDVFQKTLPNDATQLQESSAEYSVLLHFTARFYSYDALSQALTRLYLSSGAETARQQIAKYLPSNISNPMIPSGTYELLNDYLENELAIIEMRAAASCYLDDYSINVTCVDELYNTSITYASLYAEQNSLQRIFDRRRDWLGTKFIAETENLSQLVRSMNE